MNAQTSQKRGTVATALQSNEIGTVRRVVVGSLLVAALSATPIGFAAPSHADGFAADPGATNCQTEPFGFVGSQRRTLCDGPISKDGSWNRERSPASRGAVAARHAVDSRPTPSAPAPRRRTVPRPRH